MKYNLAVRFVLIILFVTLMLPVASGAAPRALPPTGMRITTPVNTPSFGLNSHLATRYPDPAGMELPAELVANLGVEWVREDFHWHRVQPAPDRWDWTFTDAAMRALLSRDIKVLGVLGPSVGWATPYRNDTPNDVSFYAPDTDAFVEYVRGVVSRYHRYVDHWEIWNEPDNPIFWRPQPDPRAYADLLMRASATIKQIDPAAQVLIGGFNPFDTTFPRAVAAAGAWDSFDILALHPYVDPYAPEEGNLAAATDAIRTLANQYGDRPIWVTELGWASGIGDRDPIGITDEEEQASYLVRSMLLLWNAGVEVSFWYNFKDDPGNPYGLVRLGSGRTDYGTLKPAYNAFRTLNQTLAGAEFVERRDLFTPRILLDFERDPAWRRPSQPNGFVQLSDREVHSGARSLQLSYDFNTLQNDYAAFALTNDVPLGGEPYALGVWVYGDGSAQSLKVWVRDAERELHQFVLGTVGPPGWHFISTPIGGLVERGNQIEGGGNGRVDFPASVAALVIDDIADRYIGRGTIFVDNLTAIDGREAYNLRLQRGSESLDVLWSPPGVRVLLNTAASSGTLIARDGNQTRLTPDAAGRLSVNLGPAPVYLRHQR